MWILSSPSMRCVVARSTRVPMAWGESATTPESTTDADPCQVAPGHSQRIRDGTKCYSEVSTSRQSLV
jgi:hypothetical protein